MTEKEFKKLIRKQKPVKITVNKGGINYDGITIHFDNGEKIKLDIGYDYDYAKFDIKSRKELNEEKRLERERKKQLKQSGDSNGFSFFQDLNILIPKYNKQLIEKYASDNNYCLYMDLLSKAAGERTIIPTNESNTK